MRNEHDQQDASEVTRATDLIHVGVLQLLAAGFTARDALLYITAREFYDVQAALPLRPAAEEPPAAGDLLSIFRETMMIGVSIGQLSHRCDA